MSEAYATVEESVLALAHSRLTALVVYVRDMQRSAAFYDSLGLRRVGETPDECSYDVGPAVLTLRPAAADDVPLPPLHDDASDIVFLVDDVKSGRAALERRGVRFERQRTYEIGTVTDFYDPDGHRLMLYEPSAHAMTTPANDTIRRVWRAYGRGGEGLIGSPAGPDESREPGLDGKPLIYCFVFVKDIADARGFYEDALGLGVMHRSHCCNDGCPDEEMGVVKYDSDGVILSSHHLHGHEAVRDDAGQAYGARDYDPALARGVAPVFTVPDLPGALRLLTIRGLDPTGVTRTPAGVRAGFVSPSGHLLYLLQAP